MSVLGAGHGLDHLVHARHVAAPLVAALLHTGRHAPLPRVQAWDTPQHLPQKKWMIQGFNNYVAEKFTFACLAALLQIHWADSKLWALTGILSLPLPLSLESPPPTAWGGVMMMLGRSDILPWQQWTLGHVHYMNIRTRVDWTYGTCSQLTHDTCAMLYAMLEDNIS